MPGNLVLISSIANHLLEATAATANQASEQVLAQLVEHFGLHYSFLRYSDHDIGASVLAAEWPPRTDVADPDPFGVIPFTSDHPALALCDNGKDLVKVHRQLRRRRISMPDHQGPPQRSADGGRRPAGLRHDDLRRAWVRQVPRPKVEARGDPHPHNGRLAVRSVPGPHLGRRAASASRRA